MTGLHNLRAEKKQTFCVTKTNKTDQLTEINWHHLHQKYDKKCADCLTRCILFYPKSMKNCDFEPKSMKIILMGEEYI